MSQNGKGRRRRVPSVDQETFASAWDRIFAKPFKANPGATGFQVGSRCTHPTTCTRNQRCSYGRFDPRAGFVPRCDDATDAPPA
jgi:hypothetical protein